MKILSSVLLIFAGGIYPLLGSSIKNQNLFLEKTKKNKFTKIKDLLIS
jgi:hypothetical protein